MWLLSIAPAGLLTRVTSHGPGYRERCSYLVLLVNSRRWARVRAVGTLLPTGPVRNVGESERTHFGVLSRVCASAQTRVACA